MTKEEKINVVKNIRNYMVSGNPIWDKDTVYEALSAAIEALERTDTHECVEPTHECVDLISRQAAIDALKENTVEMGGDDWCEIGVHKDDIEAIINALPTASKSGHWIHDTHYGLNLPEHKCSECGTWEYSDEESNFCPNCGADMRGECDENR